MDRKDNPNLDNPRKKRGVLLDFPSKIVDCEQEN